MGGASATLSSLNKLIQLLSYCIQCGQWHSKDLRVLYAFSFMYFCLCFDVCLFIRNYNCLRKRFILIIWLYSICKTKITCFPGNTFTLAQPAKAALKKKGLDRDEKPFVFQIEYNTTKRGN